MLAGEPPAAKAFMAKRDKTIDEIRREVYGKQQTFQNFAFSVNRDEDIDAEARTVKLAFASTNPIDNWYYGAIKLNFDKKSVRADRLKNGLAVLMDHNTRDQIGVVLDHSFDSDGIARATVQFADDQRAEDIFRSIQQGIRRHISVGFMIWQLDLESKSKDKPSIYVANDWEPYEISIVAVPADTAVGIGRELDDEPEPVSDASQTRAISNQEENKMTPEEIAAKQAADEQRALELADARRKDVLAFADIYGERALAEELLLANPEAVQDDIRTAIKAKRDSKPQTKIPSMDAAAAGRAALGVHTSEGEAVVDRNTRTVLQGEHLSDAQMNTICSREYKEAFLTYLQKKGERNLSSVHQRALSEGADSEGGFLVPGEFLAKMVEREPAATELQSLVTNLTTGSDKLTMPKNAYSASSLYTTGVRVAWVDEQTGPSSEADATDFGNITIPIYTAMMYHDVTNNMIEDSQFDILGWLAGKFRETADVVTENMIINGSGIGQPEGILLNPNGTDQPATVVTGSGSTVTADGLLDLTYALLGRYVDNARFVFNRLSTEKAIAKLKDSSNRYLFSTGIDADGLAVKRPKELLGFPFVSSDFMPDLGANTYPIIFGDLKGYYLVRRVGFSVQVLNEIVATSNKVRVLGRMRIGGQVAEDWRLKIQKCST